MAEQFGVRPAELRGTSGDLHDVSSEMKGVMSLLRAKLSAQGVAWGGGSIGHHLADGPNGYPAQLDWVQGPVDAKTGQLDY